jgi:cysteine desulfurase
LCQQLGREGFQIIEINVDQSGALDLDQLRASLDDETALASIMWANNETGVIFPVEAVSQLCRSTRVPFHCDATQAVGKIPTDLQAVGVNAASLAAHKFHGPKGIGALYLKRGTRCGPLLIGGPQERGRRGGTENVAGIVGMGVAAKLAGEHLPEMNRVAKMRDQLEQGILQSIPDTYVNGTTVQRVPNTSNIGFSRLEAEAILLLLSERDICASAGAACSSGSLEPSHVLKAMNIDPKIAHGAIRFSLSRYTTDAEIESAVAALPGVIARLRQVLPVEV